jgi:hypothetical protein
MPVAPRSVGRREARSRVVNFGRLGILFDRQTARSLNRTGLTGDSGNSARFTDGSVWAAVRRPKPAWVVTSRRPRQTMTRVRSTLCTPTGSRPRVSSTRDREPGTPDAHR